MRRETRQGGGAQGFTTSEAAYWLRWLLLTGASWYVWPRHYAGGGAVYNVRCICERLAYREGPRSPGAARPRVGATGAAATCTGAAPQPPRCSSRSR